MPEVLERETFQLFHDNSAIERLDAAGGLVHVADLEWPLFDPEKPMIFAEYVTEIGATITDSPRETSVKDSPLGLYRNDFKQAEVPNLDSELYVPNAGPVKSVAKVIPWRKNLDRSKYPGSEPFETGIAVTEDVYEEMVRNAAFFANQIDNRTQRKLAGKVSVEEAADIGGESVVYALADKHTILETRDQYVVRRSLALNAIHRSIVEAKTHRIGDMEQDRLEALANILEVTRVACKQLGYGTNQTNATLRAVASNTHRSPEADQWWLGYIKVAARHNNEVRGKIRQSICSCIEEIGKHTEQVINCIDREYEDD
ncbi:MAG TPA: hypothetical protein VFH99_03175 [Candidatus Saccharimonadales bacterium]|nr:hypothetical protein [Candidatus Saccharimonadales bacterium]